MNIRTIPINNQYIPYRWFEDLISKQRMGGVMLVFLEGRNKKELQTKTKKIQTFCKKLNN